MPVVSLSLPALQCSGDGQALLPRPASRHGLSPAVVVARRAAQEDEDEAVDRAGAPEHATAWPADATAVQFGFRLSLVVPVEGTGAKETGIAGRQMQVGVTVLRPRFDQSHRHRRILRKPGGDDTTRAAAAHHHVVGRLLPSPEHRHTVTQILP